MRSAWRSREELVHQVALLAKQGESRRAIARALGVSRNTVRTLLATHPETCLRTRPSGNAVDERHRPVQQVSPG
jgi:transposase